jgi:hypothetical protein
MPAAAAVQAEQTDHRRLSMSRTDLLHWRTVFIVQPRCIHRDIALSRIARALAGEDPNPVTSEELRRLCDLCRARVTARAA